MILVANRSLQILLGQIVKHKILTPLQERDLVRAAQAGNERAAQLLCEHNQKMVMLVAMKFRGNGLELDEMIEEGAIGVWIAAKRFDLTSKYRFASYAVWWVRAKILRAIDEQGRLMRISPFQARALAKLRVMPMEQFIGGTLNHPDEHLDKLPAYMRQAMEATTPTSMDTVINEHGDTYACFLEAKTENPEESATRTEREAIAGRLLHTLEPRERRIMSLLFGLESGETMTLEQVGNMFDLSRERVRQIRDGAIKELRKRAGKYGG